MTVPLVFGVMAAAFLLAAAGAGWLCLAVGARLPEGLARSSRVRAGMVMLPIAIGAAVAISLLAPMSWLAGCHCVSHPHHVHLCVEHASFTWALGLGAVLGGVGGLRWLASCTRVVQNALSTHRWARRVEASSGEGGIEVVAALGAHAVSVGLWRPRVLVGASLWSALDADGRRAVEAHELAHVARRDPLTLLCLTLIACALPSSVGRQLLEAWRRTAELACDHAAAETVGDPCTVAAVLVACGRLQLQGTGKPLNAALAMVDGGDLEARVAHLLAQPPGLERAARIRGDLVVASVTALVSTLAMALLGGARVHHAIETLLGWIS